MNLHILKEVEPCRQNLIDILIEQRSTWHCKNKLSMVMIMLQKFLSGDFLERFFSRSVRRLACFWKFSISFSAGYRARSDEQLLMIFGDVETLSDSKFSCPTNVINKLSSTKTPQTIKFKILVRKIYAQLGDAWFKRLEDKSGCFQDFAGCFQVEIFLGRS